MPSLAKQQQEAFQERENKTLRSRVVELERREMRG